MEATGKLWVQTENGEMLKFDPETNTFNHNLILM